MILRSISARYAVELAFLRRPLCGLRRSALDRRAPLSSGEARQKEDLGVLGQFLGPGVAINHPIDGDGNAALDEGSERGILLRQIAEQLADVFCLELELLLASGGGAERAPERYLDQCVTLIIGAPVRPPAPPGCVVATWEYASCERQPRSTPHSRLPPAAERSMFRRRRAPHRDDSD